MIFLPYSFNKCFPCYRSILAWENKPKTAGVFIGFLLGVYFFEPWMITLGLVIPFIKNIVVSNTFYEVVVWSSWKTIKCLLKCKFRNYQQVGTLSILPWILLIFLIFHRHFHSFLKKHIYHVVSSSPSNWSLDKVCYLFIAWLLVESMEHEINYYQSFYFPYSHPKEIGLNKSSNWLFF